MNRILVFDTTLRDGEQSPGATMTMPEKIRIAEQLENLGVDVIEAGFPAASPQEVATVRELGRAVKEPILTALARANDGDIDAAAESLTTATRPRIHTFLATSPIHREHKLRMSKEDVLQRISRAVRRAKRHVEDVEFSPEDGTRTEIDFLCDVVRVAIAAGATTINIPDTVGYSHPDDYARMVDELYAHVPELHDVVLSVHCHDDLGLATANSLAAIERGARQVECTINGIGERAGNASLEEIVMALRVLPRYRDFDTGIRAEQLCPTSELLAAVTGIRPQPNKAIVGANAFAHEAGIHQDGMLKDPSTYEIMTPESVGARTAGLVLGKHSGRHALANRYEELGFDLEPDQLDRAYELFVMLADARKEIHDEDLLAIYYQGTMQDVERVFRLEHLDVRCGRAPATATARVSRGGDAGIEAKGEGDGPVDATFAALRELAPWESQLEDFSIHSIGAGADAVGEVHLELLVGGHRFRGRAASTDIVQAAARAYLNALDKVEHARGLEERALENVQYWGV